MFIVPRCRLINLARRHASFGMSSRDVGLLKAFVAINIALLTEQVVLCDSHACNLSSSRT